MTEPDHAMPAPSTPEPGEEDFIRALPWQWASNGLNTLFALWTFGGSVFLLFLSELGLPKAQIGAVLSLFPFCGLLALGFAPWATRLGRKRVFIAGYGIPPEQNTAYTAIYYAWMGLTGGAAPLLAGALLSACGRHPVAVGALAVDGHALLFGVSLVLLALGWWFYGRVRPDDVHTTRTVLRRVFSRVSEWRPGPWGP